VAVLAASSVVARLIGGYVAGRVRLVPLAAGFSAMQVGGLAAIAVADSRVALLVAAALLGVSVGNLLMIQPLIVGDNFGVAEYARIYATTQLFMTIGVAGGPFLLGALFDQTNSWGWPYAVAAAASLAAAAVLLRAERFRADVPAPINPAAGAPAPI
jgi:MFS family permease